MQQNVWPHHIGMTPHQEENVIKELELTPC